MVSLFLRSERVTVEELLQARRFLEPALVRDATRRQHAEFIERVASLLARGRSIDIRDDGEYRRLSREFHETMASASSNRVFTLFGLALMSMFAGRMDHSVFPPEERKHVLLEHERVLKAILDKDEAKAEKLMSKHMDHFLEGVRARQPDAFRGIIKWE
jgi:DNA-binding FadR family transcriptional regulator